MVSLVVRRVVAGWDRRPSLPPMWHPPLLAGGRRHLADSSLRAWRHGATWADLGQQFAQTRIYSLASLGNGIALAGTYPDAKILRSTYW